MDLRKDRHIAQGALALFLTLAAAIAAPAGAARAGALALTGRVVDAAGRPVAGAEVVLGSQTPDRRGDEVETIVRSTTRQSGSFRIAPLPKGRTGWLLVRGAGFAPALRGVTLRPLAPVRVALRRGREVTGAVVDEAGAPIAGVEVEAKLLLDLGRGWFDSLPPEIRSALYLRTRSAADGGFRFSDVSAGELALRLRSERATPLRAAARDIPAGQGPFDLGRYTLASTRQLAGRVTDRSGAPLPGVKVLRIGIADELGDPPSWQAAWRLHPPVVTDSEGRFALTGLPSGSSATLDFCSQRYREPDDLVTLYELPSEPLVVTLEAKGKGADPRLLAPGARERTICPEPEDQAPEGPPVASVPATPSPASAQPAPARAVLSGRVLAGGKPVAGAWVRVVDLPRQFREVFAGPDGRYRVDGVEPGSLYVGAGAEGYEPSSARPDPVEIRAGERRMDFQLVRTPTPTLRGRVVDREGHGIAGALLLSGVAVHSGADGRFVLPLSRGVSFLLARKSGFAAWSYPDDLTVDPPKTLTIELARETVIEGRISGLSASDLARTSIRVDRIDGDLERGVAPDGTFRVEGLRDRRVELGAFVGARIARLELDGRDASGDPVELAFAPLFALEGRVVDLHGDPVAGAFVEANSELASRGSDHTASRGDGTFTLHLPATRFALTVHKPGFEDGLRRAVVVGDGSAAPAVPPTPQPVEVRLGPGAALAPP